MQVGPEPRGSEIEAVIRYIAIGVDGQDAPAQTFARFHEVKPDTFRMEQPRCLKTGKTAANDSDCHVVHRFAAC